MGLELELIGIGSAMDLFGQVVTVGYRGLEVWRGARHHMRGVYQTPNHDSFVRSSVGYLTRSCRIDSRVRTTNVVLRYL
jgi:hypothetical protein